jgi:hypothetical protein
MEILQNLLSLLSTNSNLGGFKPIVDLLEKNSFDLKKTLSSLDLSAVMPIITSFLSSINDKKSPTTASTAVGLDPIAFIADKEIVFTLNKYFSDPS